jgi:predicted nucleic acid-binding protein
MNRLIVDTGFLVALGRARDPRHLSATRRLDTIRDPLVTVAPVLVESCHFLDVGAKCALLDWVLEGGIAVVDVPTSSYSDIAATIRRYADRDVDFTDAALVWLAEATGHRGILTVDRGDFSVFRLKGGKRFDIVDW